MTQADDRRIEEVKLAAVNRRRSVSFDLSEAGAPRSLNDAAPSHRSNGSFDCLTNPCR